ncbi:hypothetical protein EAVNVH72_01907 [Elizabethkingia anophelis]|nr:hypothetical protein EAVNVH72_02801 [Elizabethkingia anophelis]CAI9682108.1 hypothetical protein EAVNVH72_01907 [Elizabethkingia anophelis]
MNLSFILGILFKILELVIEKNNMYTYTIDALLRKSILFLLSFTLSLVSDK